MIIFGFTAAIVFVFLFVYMGVYILCKRKEAIDTKQFNAAKAGAGAAKIGCPELEDACFWVACGNIKHSFLALRAFFVKYFQSERGPVRLAYDIFMNTWHYLRDDVEYGGKVREKVIGEALGMEISDRTDVTAVEAGVRAEAIGWPTISAMAKAWASRSWLQFGELIRALFREFMQPDGEIHIAKRVAPATFAALWNNHRVEGAHDVAQKLVENYAKQLGWTPPPSE